MTDVIEYRFPAYDNVSAGDREETLRRIVFGLDILKPGGFLIDRERIKGRILDLGCGRGAVGAVLKRVNPSITLTGVDVRTDYGGENFLNLYGEIIKGEATEVIKAIAKEGEEKFDAIVSVGLPDYVMDSLIELNEMFMLVKPDGFILLTTDQCGGHFPRGTGPFRRFEGHYQTDTDILFWSGKVPVP